MLSNRLKTTVVKLWLRGYLNWLPDKAFLKLMFYVRMGKKLDLKHPKTYSEKLQWLKLYDRKSEYIDMVDKYEAKRYVAERIGEEYIIPTLGVWEKFEDIDFESLPDRFVLKCTHDSGGLVVCRDKNTLDLEAARAKIETSLARIYYFHGREWPYKHVKPRVIAEQYMEDAESDELRDYKFYCFGGEPKFLYVSQGLSNHSTAHISYVSLDWEKMPFERMDFANFDVLPKRPLNFDKMLESCRILSANIPFLRVDFYEVNGHMYFGELTFFPGSGTTEFHPNEWDAMLGEWILLPQKNKKGTIDRRRLRIDADK